MANRFRIDMAEMSSRDSVQMQFRHVQATEEEREEQIDPSAKVVFSRLSTACLLTCPYLRKWLRCSTTESSRC